MGQEARRRVVTWQHLDPPPRTNTDVTSDCASGASAGTRTYRLDRLRAPRIGRFSTGKELLSQTPSTTRIGQFSRSQDHGRDDDPAHLHVSSYGDRSEPAA